MGAFSELYKAKLFSEGYYTKDEMFDRMLRTATHPIYRPKRSMVLRNKKNAKMRKLTKGR